MEILKSKSIALFAVLVLGVSYLSAADNVNVSHSVQNNDKIISENA